MGAVPSVVKKVKQDIEHMPRLEPEMDYEIKTRSPLPKTWNLNILRGRKEDELKNESYPIVRRKCYEYAKLFEQCEKENGRFWTPFNCQEEFFELATCFDQQLNVELDKRRRDISKNNEWWWTCLYDEKGEVGEQAEWDGSWFATMKIKELFGQKSNSSNNATKNNNNNTETDNKTTSSSTSK
jgi:hypothetical protein